MSTQEGSKAAIGTWSSTEDERLRSAVAKHGLRWVLVAAEVGTRNGEQCAKRWNDYVKPDLDHSPWTAQEVGCPYISCVFYAFAVSTSTGG
jgi:hypothetical protein